MTYPTKPIILIALLFSACLGMATKAKAQNTAPVVTLASSLQDTLKSKSFHKAIDLFYHNKPKEAMKYFKETLSDSNVPLDISLSWMAKNLKYMDSLRQAEEAARAALASNPNNSLANEVLSDLLNPQFNSKIEDTPRNNDSMWYYLMRAIKTDSNNVSAWRSVWNQSIKRKDKAMEERSLRRLWERGSFTSSVLALNRWQLEHLPPNAILITNGDNDTYPAVALQLIEQLRKDVLVVNLALLNLPWYAKFQSKRGDFPLGFGEDEVEHLEYQYNYEKHQWEKSIADQILERWIDLQESGQLSRPITIAATCGSVGYNLLQNSKYAKQFTAIGPYSCMHCTLDTTKLNAWIDALPLKDFQTPYFNPDVEHSPILRDVPSNAAFINVLIAIVRMYDNGTKEAQHWCAKALELEARAGIETEMHKELQECAWVVPIPDLRVKIPKKLKKKK